MTHFLYSIFFWSFYNESVHFLLTNNMVINSNNWGMYCFCCSRKTRCFEVLDVASSDWRWVLHLTINTLFNFTTHYFLPPALTMYLMFLFSNSILVSFQIRLMDFDYEVIGIRIFVFALSKKNLQLRMRTFLRIRFLQ